MLTGREGVARRHHVTVHGPDGAQPIVFAHGFGCDQNMWRHVAPRFADRYRVVLFDLLGMGQSDVSAYDPRRYRTLDGHAADILELCAALDLTDVVFVGHSVSSMIGVLASIAEPDRFSGLVLVAPSPRYLDDVDYVGGFSLGDIEEMLESLESNYLGWSGTMAPVIMGRPDRPELGDELAGSFCRTDPAVARQFARVTFLSDNRADLGRVTTPSLVLQCRSDVIAPMQVGQYVADHLPGAALTVLDAKGHCPNLSEPDQTSAAIEAFLKRADVAPR